MVHLETPRLGYSKEPSKIRFELNSQEGENMLISTRFIDVNSTTWGIPCNHNSSR